MRQMIDSAYPLKTQPLVDGRLADIVLIYAAGDTPHPWSKAEIAAQPNRYRWPCFVRSNPGQVDAGLDAASFILWLEQHDVPQDTAVILDLETAVNTHYVNTFNLALRAAGYNVTKYGSRSTIWENPKTDGGTFVAWPGYDPDHDKTIGDTVAVQYKFAGRYDVSYVWDSVPLWDTVDAQPPGPFRHVVPAGNTQTWHALAVSRGTEDDKLAAVTRANLNPVNLAVFDAFIALDDALKAAGLPLAAMPSGMVWWSLKP
jgi:hypothetical protein